MTAAPPKVPKGKRYAHGCIFPEEWRDSADFQSVLHPVSDFALSLTCLFGPFSSRKSLVPSIVSAIPLLLFWRCPSAILRSVVSVCVYAVNGVFNGWWFSHICEKVVKNTPSFADLYSAPAVVLETRVSGILASLVNGAPTVMNLCVAESMNGGTGNRLFLFVAAAGIGVSRNDIAGLCDKLISTLAKAFPLRLNLSARLSSAFGAFYDGESGECFSGEVYKFHAA